MSDNALFAAGPVYAGWMQGLPPSIHLPNSIFRAAGDQDEWRRRAEDRSTWQQWSGGDGSGCLLDRVDDRPAARYIANDHDALWIGRDGDCAWRIGMVCEQRRSSAAWIDAVVRVLWISGGVRVDAAAAMTETVLLLNLSRSLFLTDAVADIDAVDPQLSTAEVLLSRYNPEFAHPAGSAW